MGRRQMAVAVGLMLAMLTGCTFQAYPEIPRFAESGGQTQAELDAKLAQIPGLVFTDASGSKPNVKGNTGFGFDMELDPAYEIVDAEALVTFLVTSAWSVRDGYMPNTTVAISLYAGPLPSDKVNLVAAAEVEGWVPVGSQRSGIGEDGGSAPEFDNGWSSVEVWLAIESLSVSRAEQRGSFDNRERLGEWPGAAVEPPAGMVAPRANEE